MIDSINSTTGTNSFSHTLANTCERYRHRASVAYSIGDNMRGDQLARYATYLYRRALQRAREEYEHSRRLDELLNNDRIPDFA